MMTKMRRAWLGACLIALMVASCGYPELPALAGDDVMEPPFGLELLAGDIDNPGHEDGMGAAAHFNTPGGVAVDGSGNVYVADNGNHTIRKVTAGGDVTTLAGTAGSLGNANGTGASARFYGPLGVVVGTAGTVYVADTSNHTIRKVTTDGVVTTLAGTAGMADSMDDTGAAARFNYPRGMAVDNAGNLYVADRNNSTVRKVTAGGVVTTLAGAAKMAGSVDARGTLARFYYPSGVAVDSAGNVYVADTGNHTIRKVAADGDVTTLAGSALMSGSADGRGAAARFNKPVSVAVDGAGNVYVADTGNATIRKITPSGDTTTVAGMAGAAGIVLGAAPRFASPQYLAISGQTLVVSDANAIFLLHRAVE